MASLFPLDHVGVGILELLSEVKITFDVRRQVSNIETPGNLMDVNWLPEGEESGCCFKDQVVVFVENRPSKLLKSPLNQPGHKVPRSISGLDRSLLQKCEHHDDS